MKRLISGLCLTAALTAAIPQETAAGNVTLAWDANKETDLAGYNVYCQKAGASPEVIKLGLVTSTTLSNLVDGSSYSFYLTAFNTAGLESDPSETVSTFVQPLDTDRDGLPDTFELANGMNPANSADAVTDADGDGVSTIDEYLAGTDPFNANSALEIKAVLAAPGGNAIRFSTEAGRGYTVEANDSFPTGRWTPVSLSVAGTGSLLEVIDAAASSAAQRIYRVTTTTSKGQTVSSHPAGAQRLTMSGLSDTILSVPLLRPAVYKGKVAAVVGNSVVLPGAAWAANQLVYTSGVQSNTYFLLVRGGAREGQSFTVTANSATSVTLDLEGGSLNGLNPGDAVSIIPHWTLGTIFPAGAGVYASPAPGTRYTEVLVPNLSGTGTSLAIAHTYYFWNNAWREVGQGTAVKNDDVILPDMYVWVRNNISASTEVVSRGSVSCSNWRIDLRRNLSGKQDNYAALPRVTATSLNSSGLIQSGAFRASALPGNRIDELLVFDNASIGKNKAPSATYYYWNGAWRKVGSGTADVGNDLVIAPGSGFIIRSGAGESCATWTNCAGY